MISHIGYNWKLHFPVDKVSFNNEEFWNHREKYWYCKIRLLVYYGYLRSVLKKAEVLKTNFSSLIKLAMIVFSMLKSTTELNIFQYTGHWCLLGISTCGKYNLYRFCGHVYVRICVANAWNLLCLLQLPGNVFSVRQFDFSRRMTALQRSYEGMKLSIIYIM